MSLPYNWQIRLYVSVCYPTLPRWPKSQEFACGLLKQDNLCVYQACRTNSFAVQTATTVPNPAATTYRTWERPIQLRTSERAPWRRDILEEKIRYPGCLTLSLLCQWLCTQWEMLKYAEKQTVPTHNQCFNRNNCSNHYEWHHFLCLIKWPHFQQGWYSQKSVLSNIKPLAPLFENRLFILSRNPLNVNVQLYLLIYICIDLFIWFFDILAFLL